MVAGNREAVVEKIWKPALATGGVAAIGAFVFCGLYKGWLELSIFQQLSSQQTFIVMLVFLVFVFLLALSMLIAWFMDRSRSSYGRGAVTFSLPALCTFEEVVRALASEDESVVRFEGFDHTVLQVKLKAQTIEASTTARAIELVGRLSESALPHYKVFKRDGEYVVSTL